MPNTPVGLTRHPWDLYLNGAKHQTIHEDDTEAMSFVSRLAREARQQKMWLEVSREDRIVTFQFFETQLARQDMYGGGLERYWDSSW